MPKNLEALLATFKNVPIEEEQPDIPNIANFSMD